MHYLKSFSMGFTIFVVYISLTACSLNSSKIQQWKEMEISFISAESYENPYTDVEMMILFAHSSGDTLIRPAFWYGSHEWRVRFASPYAEGQWNWKSLCSNPHDKDLHDQRGILNCVPYTGNDPLTRKGLLKMSSGKRNIEFADGGIFFLIGDTPWALPWRGTRESVSEYAKNRQERGFNAALLMSLQPDRDARGLSDRKSPGSFAVAFTDLKDGHINKPDPGYFMTLDTLRNILLDHGIVPVFQPVFHGFGWKGLNVLGWDMNANEYARYCRYLLARYGARHAIWLVGGDGNGKQTGVREGGMELEQWDAYTQPTGIHYNPFDDWAPEKFNQENAFHYNRSWQDEEWLDFQWCQTGHNGEHLIHKVARMYENKPVKGVANGEPTYEGINHPEKGSGWWQGREAWLQFTAGGTMGVVYGAGGLWNWKLFPDEEGWPVWADSKVSWKEAIELPGAWFVGYLGKALEGLDISDIEKHPEMAQGNACLAKPGELYIVYLENSSSLQIDDLSGISQEKWFDPKTGEFVNINQNIQGNSFNFDGELPIVLILD